MSPAGGKTNIILFISLLMFFWKIVHFTDDGTLTEWSDWTCVESCGDTTEYRNRTCESDDDYPHPEKCPPSCDGQLNEERDCNAGCCGSKNPLQYCL